VHGRITASTRNGTVRILGTPPRFEASTRNGRIEILLGAGAQIIGRCEVATQNGAILLRVPRSLGARVSATTSNGRIQSDVPLTKQGPKHSTGTLGAGGPEIALSTQNGAIRIELQ
jgi:DUF4097 and DUF4098 domain-containing protein YvlB